MNNRVALIGLGPHARKVYYPYLSEYFQGDPSASFELLVELKTQQETAAAFLEKQKIQPKRVEFLDADTQLRSGTIDPLAAASLKEHKINKALIATEPKAHKVYIEECIKRGIHVMTDKPVTAPVGLVTSIEAAENIYNDVARLAEMTDQHPNSRVLVQSQRRNHAGYRKVFDVLEALIKEYDVPITYISIHHSDGMWNMPDEFVHRENHPYKYGYGKLMHSGYHFVDLLTLLLRLSSQASSKTPDTITLFSQYIRPGDQHTAITEDTYERFFGKATAAAFSDYMHDQKLHEFGEVDSYSQLQAMKHGIILTTAQLSLIQTGFSQRAWPILPDDTYKSNGRLRHEYINIHVGPLASVQIHSYQSQQSKQQGLSHYDTGGANHFDIYIFRNSNLIGGKAFEKIQFGEMDLKGHEAELYMGQNEYARRQTLDELLQDLPSQNELRNHLPANKLLSEIYKNHARQSKGETPFVSFNAVDIL